MKSVVICLAIHLPRLYGCAAHMMLEWPTPYGNNTLNNSPLEVSGSDFPCKLRQGVYDLAEMNHWIAGEAQSVRFLGSAVHGGGSCQFSVTTDAQPTKSSQWKVVDSRVGGCPASAAGNLEIGPLAKKADSFDVVLPGEMPNGLYTFAWTWFNRVGNREMYMNCAPITVSGGGDNFTFLESLPNMFVANLPDTECATIANLDLAFPEPGKSVVTAEQANIVSTLEGSGCSSMTELGAGGGTMRLPQITTKSSNSQTDGRNVPSDAYTSAPGHLSQSTLVENSALVSSTASGRPRPSVATNAPRTQESEFAAITTASSSACLVCQMPGDVICIDDRHFGLCNGTCALRQPLAAGTYCFQGSILKRSTPHA